MVSVLGRSTTVTRTNRFVLRSVWQTFFLFRLPQRAISSRPTVLFLESIKIYFALHFRGAGHERMHFALSAYVCRSNSPNSTRICVCVRAHAFAFDRQFRFAFCVQFVSIARCAFASFTKFQCNGWLRVEWDTRRIFDWLLFVDERFACSMHTRLKSIWMRSQRLCAECVCVCVWGDLCPKISEDISMANRAISSPLGRSLCASAPRIGNPKWANLPKGETKSEQLRKSGCVRSVPILSAGLHLLLGVIMTRARRAVIVNENASTVLLASLL